jgi:hypothetical protein
MALLLLVGGAIAEELKSGPQPGDTVRTPFNPLHCNGDSAGEKVCLI